MVDNTGDSKKVINGQFPDIILYGKESPLNNTVLFTLKIENGAPLLDSLPAWKELGNAPFGFYIVVPKEKLPEAKQIVSVTGIKAKFASYIISNEKVEVTYE